MKTKSVGISLIKIVWMVKYYPLLRVSGVCRACMHACMNIRPNGWRMEDGCGEGGEK